MFGVPHLVLEDMYGGADNIPITGMLTGWVKYLNY